MSFWGDVKGIVDPGGDPTLIHDAAAACRTLADELGQIQDALDKAAAALLPHGPNDSEGWSGSAGQEFQSRWRTTSQGIAAYAKTLDTKAAPQLDDVADEIHTADVETRRMFEMMAVTAGVGLGLTLLTMGISDAVAEGTEVAETAEAAGIIARLASILDRAVTYVRALVQFLADDPAAFFRAFLRAGMKVGVMGALGGLESVASELINKATNHEPLTLNAADVGNIFLGAVLTMILGTAGPKIPGINKPVFSGPVSAGRLTLGAGAANLTVKALASAGYGFVGGFSGSILAQSFVQGEPISWTKALESGGVSFVVGGAMTVGASGLSAVSGKIAPYVVSTGRHAAPSTNPIAVGLRSVSSSVTAGLAAVEKTPGDIGRTAIGLPAGVIINKINFGVTTPPSVPKAPAAIPGMVTPVDHPQNLYKVYNLQPGQTLWGITGGNWNEINQILAANHIKSANSIPAGRIAIPASLMPTSG